MMATYMQHLFLYTAVVTPSDPHSSERILIRVAAIVSVSESLSLLLLLLCRSWNDAVLLLLLL